MLAYAVWCHFFRSSSHLSIREGRGLTTMPRLRCNGVSWWLGIRWIDRYFMVKNLVDYYKNTNTALQEQARASMNPSDEVSPKQSVFLIKQPVNVQTSSECWIGKINMNEQIFLATTLKFFVEQWWYSPESLLSLTACWKASLTTASIWTKQQAAIFPSLRVHWDLSQKLYSISIQMNFTGDIQRTKKSCFGADRTTFSPPNLWQVSLSTFILHWVHFQLTLILNPTGRNSLFLTG